MVKPAYVGVTGDGAEAGDLKGGADFIPVFHERGIWVRKCKGGMEWGRVQKGGGVENAMVCREFGLQENVRGSDVQLNLSDPNPNCDGHSIGSLQSEYNDVKHRVQPDCTFHFRSGH